MQKDFCDYPLISIEAPPPLLRLLTKLPPPLTSPSKNHPLWVPHKPFFIHVDCSSKGTNYRIRFENYFICYSSALKGLEEPRMEHTLLHKTKRIQVFNIRLSGELHATFAVGLIAKARDRGSGRCVVVQINIYGCLNFRKIVCPFGIKGDQLFAIACQR